MAEETTITTSTATDGKQRPRRYYYPLSYESPRSRHLFSGLVTLALLAGLIALVLYLVYRPLKPQFSVTSAAVYGLDASSPAGQVNAVSTSMQFTLVARNPNDHGSILYDGLYAYVSYRNQPITPPMPLPPLAQERDSSVAVSPVLGGTNMPVSYEVAAGLTVDQKYGVIGLRVVVVGKIRYKSGPFRIGWHGLYVRCDVLVGVKKGINAGPVPLIGEPQCKVDA